MRSIPHRPNPAGALEALWLIDADLDATVPVAIDAAALDTAPRTEPRTLRIFHFNDLHHALRTSGGDEAAPLFSGIVARYRAARAAAPPDEIVLLLSGGDDHTGTPLDELLGWSGGQLLVDPAYAAYSAAGVDACAIGNHDLDRGSEVLAAGIRGHAAFPLLCANLRGAAALEHGRDYFDGAIALARGLRIGFIGLLTPVDTRTATPTDPDLHVASPLATLRALLPAIAALSDVVIVMSHCGYGLDDAGRARAAGRDFLPEGDVAIARLAASLTQRPVIVMGAHSHTLLNEDGLSGDALIGGIPIIQAGAHGSHVGELVARIPTSATRDTWTVAATVHPLRACERTESPHEDPPFDADYEARVVEPLVARVADRMREVLACNDGGAELAEAAVARDRYMGECALMNFVTDALVARSLTFAQGRADLAMLNATALAGGLREGGDVTFGDAYRMMPFADCLQLCTIDGAELLAILASNAPRLVRPAEPGTEIDLRSNLARGFVHFSRELRYTIAAGTAASEARVTGATYGGVALESLRDRRFRIVMTNYLGGGGYRERWNGDPVVGAEPLRAFDLRPLPKVDTGLVFRNEIIAHMRAVGRIGPATGARRDQRLLIR